MVAGATAAGTGPGLEFLARGGEDCHTLGRKLSSACLHQGWVGEEEEMERMGGEEV